ncbi:MAG: sialidase family protein [Anaerolineae bacterium]
MHLVEVKYQPELTRTYLGSPSLVRLADGALLASHDYFGPGCPRNHEAEESLTSIHRSEDDGASWTPLTHVMNCYWSTLFYLGQAAYLLGVSQQYGSLVIRRSLDGGHTWSHPADAHSGLLRRGGPLREPPNYHCAPVPVLVHAGRIYKGFEDCTPNDWGRGFQAIVVSAPADADLLDAANWTFSNSLPFDQAWLRPEWSDMTNPGFLEGNAVAAPDGGLWDILRLNANPRANLAVRLQLSADGRQLTFGDFIDFPGAMTKFTIRRCPRTGRYLALVNPVTGASCVQRNLLALSVSDDLVHWRIVRELLRDESGLEPADSLRLTGFQYVDWQFDGADLIYLVRAAYRGAHNFHDANRILYGVLRGYEQYL